MPYLLSRFVLFFHRKEFRRKDDGGEFKIELLSLLEVLLYETLLLYAIITKLLKIVLNISSLFLLDWSVSFLCNLVMSNF